MSFTPIRTDPPDDGPGTLATVIVALVLTVAGMGVFVAGLLTGASLPLYGGGLALAFVAFAVAVRRGFAATYPHVEAAEPRHLPTPTPGPMGPVPATRRWILRALAASGAVVGVGLLAPLRSLDQRADGTAPWQAGDRLVDDFGRPVLATDVPAEGVALAWPENGMREELAAVIVVRLPAGAVRPPTRAEWVVDGEIVAYSKICTHTGCPVGLFRALDGELFCPCHQASFDARRGAVPTAGPAARPLPQLPLGTDAKGYLVALGEFEVPVGPVRG